MNNAARIDISKGKRVVSVLRPFGEMVAKPFHVGHISSERKELANYLKSLDCDTRVVMEHTGRYYVSRRPAFSTRRASLSARSIRTHKRLREQHPAQSKDWQGGFPEDHPLWA